MSNLSKIIFPVVAFGLIVSCAPDRPNKYECRGGEDQKNAGVVKYTDKYGILGLAQKKEGGTTHFPIFRFTQYSDKGKTFDSGLMLKAADEFCNEGTVPDKESLTP